MDCKMQKLIFCCLNTSFLCVLIRWNIIIVKLRRIS
nr:MAG TPA: hypothetical protein [Caudoviricetes sp.]